MKKHFYFLFVLAAALISSCNNDGAKENTEEASAQDTVQAVVESEVHSYALPSPLQIVSIFRNSGIGYLEGIANQQKDCSKYSSNASKAMNLGVYSADLAYCVLNQQTQEALNYVKLSKQLAGDLGMSSIFERSSAYSRFEKNLGNKDSLIGILADLQMETDSYLDEAEQQTTSLTIYSGAWIESMYIGSKFFERNNNRPVLGGKISEQMHILNNLLKMFASNKTEDDAILSLVNDLKALKNTYDNFESVKKQANVEDQPGPIEIKNEEVVALAKQVEEIRTKIVMNQ